MTLNETLPSHSLSAQKLREKPLLTVKQFFGNIKQVEFIIYDFCSIAVSATDLKLRDFFYMYAIQAAHKCAFMYDICLV